MSISEAQRRAVAKYNAANYDRIELRVDKGMKDALKAHAERFAHKQTGDNPGSLNAFINRAIKEAIVNDLTEE